MWFVGDVGQAVAESKARNAVFVVYVNDDSDESSRMTQAIEGPSAAAALSDRSFVCIKISRGTPEYSQFSQIFPVVKIPCTYFIGLNGVPLDIVSGYVSETDLAPRIAAVVEKHRASVATIASPPPSVPEPAAISRQVSGAEAVPADPEPPESSLTSASTSGATGGEQPRPSGATAGSTSSDFPPALSMEEKMERAQQLLDKRRAEKEREELEKQKEQERERRRVGQEVQKFKEWQTDEERKKMADERKKDREDEKKARERVLAQIELDRKDRAARFQQHKQEEEQKEKEARQKQLLEERQRMEVQAAEQSNNSRIQFRLPDGSSAVNTFPADATFGEVRSYVTAEVVSKNPGVGSEFKLCTLYPRRTFGPESDTQTLRSLQLAPTAVLLVLPKNSKTFGAASPGSGASAAVTTATGGASWLFWTLLSPVLAIFEYVRFFIFGTPRSAADWRAPGSSRDPTPSSSSASIRRDGPAGVDPSAGDGGGLAGGSGRISAGEEGARRRNVGSRVVLREQQGNVRKFANPDDVSAEDDDDDDNGTWNGNSTQQL